MTPGLLLDTHVLQWWWCSPGLLSAAVRARLGDSHQRVVVSAVSWLELSVALETVAFEAERPAAGLYALLRRFPQALAEEGFSLLPVQRAHLQRAGRRQETASGSARTAAAWSLWVDRLLVAQAQEEGLRLVSLDPALAALGVPLLW